MEYIQETERKTPIAGKHDVLVCGAGPTGISAAGANVRIMDVNAACVYIYESQLEYAAIMLRYHTFSGADLAPYLPFIEQSVIFYDAHYRFRCKQLTGKELDENGKLAIYPASTLEHHTDARNPTSVIAGLRRVLGELKVWGHIRDGAKLNR